MAIAIVSSSNPKLCRLRIGAYIDLHFHEQSHINPFLRPHLFLEPFYIDRQSSALGWFRFQWRRRGRSRQEEEEEEEEEDSKLNDSLDLYGNTNCFWDITALSIEILASDVSFATEHRGAIRCLNYLQCVETALSTISTFT